MKPHVSIQYAVHALLCLISGQNDQLPRKIVHIEVSNSDICSNVYILNSD